MNRRHLLLPSIAAAAGALLLTTPGIASAHVEPDVTSVPAGEQATVAFTLEHGCDESPTTGLEMQVPASITDAKAVDKAGWTTTAANNVVTFTGGPQDANEETAFSITFTAPAAGTELRFPTVQTCETGEIAWIDPTEDDEHPAPVVAVGEAGSTSETEGSHHEEETTTTGSGSEQAAQDEADDSSPAIGLIVGGLAVIALIVGGVVLLKKRGDTDAS